MSASDLLSALLEAALASSAAMVLVLLLRVRARRVFGAGVAYSLWALVPIAMLATALPPAVTSAQWDAAVGITVLPAMPMAAARSGLVVDSSWWWVGVWSVGVLLSIGWIALLNQSFIRSLGPLQRRADGLLQATAVAGLPAVLGFWSCRIVVPADFDTCYSPQQRALMLEHERSHIRHCDLHCNALVALLRALFWFNPLLQFCVCRYIRDQELACDERVVARHPQARRAYGEAMFRSQLTAQSLPVGCHWSSTHPLKERIAMLNRPLPTRRRWIAGSALVASLSLVAGVGAWAAQSAVPAATNQTNVVNVRMKVINAEGKMIMGPQIINQLEKPFSISYGERESSPDKVDVIMVASLQADGRIAVAAKVHDGGRVLARQHIVLTDSQPAVLDLGVRNASDPKNNGWRVELDASTRAERVGIPAKIVPGHLSTSAQTED